MNNLDRHPDPITEGFVHSGQRLVQVVTAATATYQLFSRLRARRKPGDTRTDAEIKQILTQARNVWRKALEPDWLSSASLPSTAQAWGATFASDDQQAERARALCERRLHRLNPEAMAVYDEWRTAGHDQLHAMSQAAAHAAKQPRTIDELVSDDFPHSIQEALRLSQSRGFLPPNAPALALHRVKRRTR